MHIDKLFYHKCRRDTWRLLKRIPEPDRQDVLNDALCRFIKLERGLVVRDPSAYLYTIMGYVVREYQRKQRREAQHIVFDSDELDRATNKAAEPGSSPLEQQVSAAQEVHHALSQLQPTHQAVIVLTQCLEYTREEAAKELELSVHTVKRYTSEALRRLRQLIVGAEAARPMDVPTLCKEPDCE